MLKCENIRVQRGGKTLLSGVSLTVREGRYNAIIGANGAGKTTLMGVLSGIDRPESGRVLLDGKDVARIPARERARRMAVVQQREMSAMPFTAMEVALMGLNPWHMRGGGVSEDDLQKASLWMEKTDTLRFACQRVDTLSGGEFQRLVLARAMLQSPRYLFLDEAMSEMDVRMRCLMLRMLREEIEENGLTVIAVHHDLSQAYQESDHVLALKDGSLLGFGPTRQYMTRETIGEIFGVEADILAGKGIWVKGALDKERKGE